MSGPARSAVGIIGVLVAAALGFGAVQELVVRGVRGGEVQAFVVGLLGAVVSLSLGLAALAQWRRRTGARRMAIIAALAAIVFHAYAALPPHRYVGMFALLIAVVYAVILLVTVLRDSASTSGGASADPSPRSG